MRSISQKRWNTAQKYQRDYQDQKAQKIRGHASDLILRRTAHARSIQRLLAPYFSLDASTRILEVGSGAHGIVFYLTAGKRFGIDPLAYYYQRNFSGVRLDTTVNTVVAMGETLPIASGLFELVICDNVLNHTMNPESIIKEVQRILTPNGVFFLAVDVNRRSGQLLSQLHERFISRWKVLKWFGSHPFYFHHKDISGLISKNHLRPVYTNFTPSPSSIDKKTSLIRRIKLQLWESLFRPRYCQIVCEKRE